MLDWNLSGSEIAIFNCKRTMIAPSHNAITFIAPKLQRFFLLLNFHLFRSCYMLYIMNPGKVSICRWSTHCHPLCQASGTPVRDNSEEVAGRDIDSPRLETIHLLEAFCFKQYLLRLYLFQRDQLRASFRRTCEGRGHTTRTEQRRTESAKTEIP